MANKNFATTLPYPDDPRFAERAQFIEVPSVGLGEQTLGDEIKLMWRILRTARHTKVLLLFSSWGRFHPDLLATAVIGLLPKRFHPLIILMGEMWQPSSGKKHYLERLIIKLADRAIYRYAFLSTDELEIFPQLWHIDPRKGRFCPYFFTIDAHELILDEPQAPKFIFAGGNSFRDYDTLLQVARQLPEQQFVIATSRLDGRTDIPPNVTTQFMSHQQFLHTLQTAEIVIIPMQQGLSRAVGQQTYLNAMWLGKPTIVNHALGVLDHVQPNETAIVVDGSPDSYVTAVQWIRNPQNQAQVARMTQQAHQVTKQQFSFEQHIICLLNIVDEAIFDWNNASFATQQIQLQSENAPNDY